MGSINNIINNTKRYLSTIDVVFLIFMLLITNVSLVIKLAGVIFIYLFRFNKDFKWGKLPLFYPLIIILIFLQTALNYNVLSLSYLFLLIFAVFLWIVAFLVIHQIENGINISGINKIKSTIVIFFTINTIVSIFNIVKIMIEIQNINPYNTYGMDLYYGMSTGDHIFGVFQDTSTTNSCINVLGFIYFIYQRKFRMAFLSLSVVLITTSNINIVILASSLALMFFLRSNKLLKTILVCSIGLIITFFVKVSPNNLKYFADKLHLKYELNNTPSDNKIAFPIDESQANNKTISDFEKKDLEIYKEIYARKVTLEKQKELKKNHTDSLFIKQQSNVSKRILLFSQKIYGDSLDCVSQNCEIGAAGKVLAFKETINYSLSSPARFFLGSGAGRFSSKSAFKASGIGVYGSYPQKFRYINEDFKNNHLQILTFYFLQSPDKHSATNTPFSVFNQLLGEYGLIGIVLFIFFYVFFFVKRFKFLTYGKILLPIMLLFFVTDYWFEHLSVVIIFEMMMFLDLHGSNKIEDNVQTTN